LYRIVQQALANVRRHANASHVVITLVTFPERVSLSVEDDGRGFDPEQVPKGRYGLIGLNERVKLLGGRLSVTSAPGKGTRLKVEIPMDIRQ
jgi:signal transduction histidine kinase